jgi:tetratricopeptide (TPR) repeat protein
MLARLLFHAGNFEEGLKAFATNYKDEDFVGHLMHPNLGALPQTVDALTSSTDEATKKLGEKLADNAAAWLKIQAVNGFKDEKLKPKAILAWYASADIRHAAKQADKQKAVYDEMSAALGTDDQLLGHIALWFKENQQRDKARQTYAKYQNVAEGQGQIAHSFVEEKNYDKAADLYRQLASKDVKTAPRWLGLAASAYRTGQKPDLAIAIYRELIVADAPNAADYNLQIAETFYRANRWVECINAYRNVAPTPHTYEQMARAQRQLKKYDEAIRLYTQIIVAFPPSAPSALYHIATTHEQAGKPEEAIKVFKQVCDRYPKSTEGSQAHAHLNEKYKIAVTLGGAKD